MKTLKELFYLLTACMFAIGFSSCEKEDGTDGPKPGMIWDIHPIDFAFTLTGENGEDLLDPATPGTYDGLRITATYKDRTYEKDVFDWKDILNSRALLVRLFGIRTTQLGNGRYALVFGDLDGAGTYEDDTITIDWKDGTQDVITFSSEMKWKDHKPSFNRTFKLNDKEVDGTLIDIKKKALTDDATHDIAPIVFSFFIRNQQGYDLLNTSVDGHIEQDSIKAIFQGQEYYVNQKTSDSRTYLPEFTGLTRPWHDQNDTNAYPTYFGELDGTQTFEDETLVIDMGSWGRDTITFTSKMEYKDNKPFFNRTYKLNGKEVSKNTSRPIIDIRKEK